MGEPRQDYFKTVDSDDFSNILAKDPILQSLWRFVSEKHKHDYEEYSDSKLYDWRQIGHNLRIIKLLRKEQRLVDYRWHPEKCGIWLLRRNLAIYRLYNFGIDLDLLKEITHLSNPHIKWIIGKVFAILCSDDKSCPFHKTLGKMMQWEKDE